MLTTGINSSQNIYKTSVIHTFRKLFEGPIASLTGGSDTVSISNEARGLSIPGSVDINDPKIKADLEALALPDWFASLLPKEAVSTPTLGTPYTEMYKETGNEKAVNYCKKQLSDIACEEALKTGVSSAERYSMKISQPNLFKEYDEKLYQSVRNRLLADEQYVKYMEYLGITI